MLSVIIPNYNKGHYLGQCIESVLGQTYTDIEVIIIDDCSTDRSPQLILQYAQQDDRIKPILLQKNVGVSAARNIGITHAQGEYITMLDSDDFYWNKNKLKAEMQVMREHTECCIAYSYRILVDENGNPIEKRKDERRYVSGQKMLFHFLTEWGANNYVQRDYVTKKEALIHVGMYSIGKSYYEDYDLLLRLVSICPIYYTGEYGTAYRIVDNGLANQHKQDDAYQFRVPMQIRKKYIKNIPDITTRVLAQAIWRMQVLLTEIRICRRKIFVRKKI